MAMMGSQVWNGPQDQQMHSASEDDFQQFLDMNGMGNLAEGITFDFQDFHHQNTNLGASMMQGPSPPPPPPPHPHREPMDIAMSGTNEHSIPSRPSSAMQAAQMHAMSTGASHPSIPASMIPPPTPRDAISEIDAQIQYLQQQRMQQQQRQMEEQQVAYFAHQSRMVPPTPQSLEIQAGSSQFYATPEQQSQQQAMYDPYQRLKDQQDMAFTPLVSPAVTPLETQFPSDAQFTVPAAYFSPLTSPALHAQNDLNSVFDQRLMTHTTSSPQEMDLESTPASNLGPTPNPHDLAKKARKNSAAKVRAKGNVRQSPISKPQRRKPASTPILSAQILSELAETAEGIDPRVQQLAPTSTSPRAGTTDSENGSVSPEALSDMPPPPVPKPKSARPSPYMQPQNSAQPAAAARMPMSGMPSPATPASLMKLSSPSTSRSAASENAEQGAPEHIENFELPESLTQSQQPQRPQPTRLDTQMLAQMRSPSLDPGPAKSGGFQPLPSPSFAKPTYPASASQSPQLMPGSSSSSAAARMTPTLAPRGSKKRASISSVQVSPALRPRISPSIKPLLPGGSSAEDTASRLLMSKSNYQNILEGNTVPGVWYPSELSTNLTSKRTSHKIAEQGRRNRINSALQEIATLLPKSEAMAAAAAAADAAAEGKGSEGDEAGSSAGDRKDKASGANAPNSKASTVEMAIEYIKQLKQEVADATRRAEEAERKLEMKDRAG